MGILIRSILGILFVGVLLLSISCQDSISTNDDLIFPESDIDYYDDIYPFFMVKCSYQGCHSDEHRAGGIRLTEYYSLFETSANGLVVPYKPDNSVLIQYLDGTFPHAYPYEFTNGYITDNQLQGMRTWISEGAKMSSD